MFLGKLRKDESKLGGNFENVTFKNLMQTLREFYRN